MRKGDGVFDKMSNKDIVKSVWDSIGLSYYENIHEFCSKAVDNVIRECFFKRTLDNVTVIIISLKNLYENIFADSFLLKDSAELSFGELEVENFFNSHTKSFRCYFFYFII